MFGFGCWNPMKLPDNVLSNLPTNDRLTLENIGSATAPSESMAKLLPSFPRQVKFEHGCLKNSNGRPNPVMVPTPAAVTLMVFVPANAWACVSDTLNPLVVTPAFCV